MPGSWLVAAPPPSTKAYYSGQGDSSAGDCREGRSGVRYGMRSGDLAMAVAAGLSMLAIGCVTSTFVATDGRAAGRPITQPSVFIDRLPPVSFYSVGIIEVKTPAGWTLDTVVAEAARKGSEVGCDFVVDRSIYHVSYGIPGVRAVVAQIGASPVIAPAPVVAPQPAPVYSPPPNMREFICGLADPSARGLPPVAGAASNFGPSEANGNRPAHIGAVVDARTAPSKVAPCLTTLTIGAPVVVLGEARDGWVAVKLSDGRSGYVWANAVQYDPPR